MREHGLGGVYQPRYEDPKTGESRISKVWWIRYSFRGVKYRESCGSRKRAVAVKLLRKRLAEIGQGRVIGPSIERTTFEDLRKLLLEDYRINARKSLETAEGSMKALAEFFEHDRALDITFDRLTAYVTHRFDAGRKPATVRNELAALKRAFTLGERAGKAVRPPFPTISVSNARKGFFEEADFRAVLAGLPAELCPVVEFAFLTGWRQSEIFGLQWRNVDFTSQTVRLEPGTTMNDEGRTFPFAGLPELGALLQQQREWTSAVEVEPGAIIPWVFHRQGRAIRDIRGAWKAACIAAGVFEIVNPAAPTAEQRRKPAKVYHDFRRTAVRNLERAGVSRSVAMKLTGHKTEAVYRRYAIVAEADLTEGVKKLATLRARTVKRAKAAARGTVTLLPIATDKERAKSAAVGG